MLASLMPEPHGAAELEGGPAETTAALPPTPSPSCWPPSTIDSAGALLDPDDVIAKLRLDWADGHG